jgi:hypothetical protein
VTSTDAAQYPARCLELAYQFDGRCREHLVHAEGGESDGKKSAIKDEMAAAMEYNNLK